MRAYLSILEDIENAFPGYETEIMGIERRVESGRTVFYTLCLKD